MSQLDRLRAWHQTKAGLLVFGLAELALAYLFALWAIDSGSLVDYFLTIVLVIGGLQNIVKLLMKVVRRGHPV